MLQKASNSQVKLLRKLGQKKYREKEGLFLVEGERAVQQFLENKTVRMVDFFVVQGKELPSFLTTQKCYELDSELFSELTNTETPQRVLAVCKIPGEISIDLLKDQEGVIIATDSIQDPGNLGTIIRTATWFGAKGLILGKGTVDMFNPKVVRSMAGATGVIPFLNSELNPVFELLEQSGWEVLFLDGNPGAESLNMTKLADKTVLVVGNEANGIDPGLITTGRKRVMIPSQGTQKTVESLNAAIALSIALYAIHS